MAHGAVKVILQLMKISKIPSLGKDNYEKKAHQKWSMLKFHHIDMYEVDT